MLKIKDPTLWFQVFWTRTSVRPFWRVDTEESPKVDVTSDHRQWWILTLSTVLSKEWQLSLPLFTYLLHRKGELMKLPKGTRLQLEKVRCIHEWVLIDEEGLSETYSYWLVFTGRKRSTHTPSTGGKSRRTKNRVNRRLRRGTRLSTKWDPFLLPYHHHSRLRYHRKCTTFRRLYVDNPKFIIENTQDVLLDRRKTQLHDNSDSTTTGDSKFSKKPGFFWVVSWGLLWTRPGSSPTCSLLSLPLYFGKPLPGRVSRGSRDTTVSCDRTCSTLCLLRVGKTEVEILEPGK